MSTLADRTIEANRTTQDRLAQLVAGLSDEDLSRPSGASEWPVAQVLSHLGSGAEITSDTLRAAESGEARPGDANGPVWERWNAMSPREQADGFLHAGEELVAALEGLSPKQREQLRVPMGFLPEPADVALFTGMRLNEAAMHAWDAEVAFDPAAVVATAVAEVLLDQLRGPLGFLLGFAGKLDRLQGRTASLLVRTTDPEAALGLSLTDRAVLVDAPTEPDGELRLPAEALLRLLEGRLTTAHTPGAVSADGSVSIDDLRRVFPGY